jgi:outer membrane protein TolC
VRAALASVDAELAGLSAARRDWLRPSLVVDFDRTTQIFPGGVALTDREVGAGLSFALPVLDRGAEARAVGLAATWQAEARLEVVRADVRSELVQARVAWVAAVDGLAAHAETPEVLARDEALTADALATGEIDATERAVLIRRLIEAGRSYDGAVREVRVRAPRGSGHPVGGRVSRSCNRSWW